MTDVYEQKLFMNIEYLHEVQLCIISKQVQCK